MRRSFTIVSIVGHTIVVGALCFAQLLAVGELPNPHTPLTFAGAVPVRIIDIPLPAPRRSDAGGPAPSAGARSAAPLDAPGEVRAESPASPVGSAPADTVGVEPGLGSGTALGTAAVMPAAPATAAPAPATPVRLHDGVRPPRKIVHVDPNYPRVARDAGISGTVILDTVIDVDGRVTAVRVLRSIPLLDQAAIDAVRGWTFTPTLVNGVAVPVALTVTVRFALSDR